MPVYHLQAWCQHRPKREVTAAGLGVRDGCELPRMVEELRARSSGGVASSLRCWDTSEDPLCTLLISCKIELVLMSKNPQYINISHKPLLHYESYANPWQNWLTPCTDHLLGVSDGGCWLLNSWTPTRVGVTGVPFQEIHIQSIFLFLTLYWINIT